MKRRIRFFFRWYDLWIGLFWDRKGRYLYICPLPTIGVRIYLGPLTRWEDKLAQLIGPKP